MNVRKIMGLNGLWLVLLLSLNTGLSCQSATKQTSSVPSDSFHCVQIPKEQLDFFRQQPPIKFWQKVILLTKDSCIVVHKDSRNMMDVISAKQLDSLVDYSKLERSKETYLRCHGQQWYPLPSRSYIFGSI